MTERIILYFFYGMMLLNFTIFGSLLVLKIVRKYMDQIKMQRYEIWKRYMYDFISSAGRDVPPKLISSLDQGVIEEICYEWLGHASGDTKKLLLLQLTRIGSVEKELKNLKKRSRWVRARAAYHLGKMESIEAVPNLLVCLQSDSRDLHYNAAQALLRITGTTHVEEVIHCIYAHHREMRNVILDLIKDVEDIYPVMASIYTKGQSDLQVIALLALGQNEDTRGIPFAREALRSVDKECKIAALKYIEQIGNIEEEEFIDLLKGYKEDADWEVRAFLAKALGRFLSMESAALLKQLMGDPHWNVRLNAGTSLVKHKQQGIMILSEVLVEKDSYASDMAWKMLEEYNLYVGFEACDLQPGSAMYEQVYDNIFSYRFYKEGGIA